MKPRIPLVFPLHCANLYGTERMAINILRGVREQFDGILLSPQGPVVAEARQQGIEVRLFQTTWQLIVQLRRLLQEHEQLAFMATGVVHSFILIALNAIYRRKVAHFHRVPGGTDERLSYGRKKYLVPFDVTFITNSAYTRSRLAAHGVGEDRVVVIENFLDASYLSRAQQRVPFTGCGVRHIAVVSRIDPIKRIDVLLDALDKHPQLSELSIRIYGLGELFAPMKARAQRHNANVEFVGFSSDIQSELSKADLLVHLCPEEPFGLAIIEAMAAHVPVLVPDQGGAADLVEDGSSGYRFRANDPDDLAQKLKDLMVAPAERLQATADQAMESLNRRFSAHNRIADYSQQLRNGIKRSA